MIPDTHLKEIADAQRVNLLARTEGLKREILSTIPEPTSHALIISGIRRCGKSTLLTQLLRKKYRHAFFFNFEDPRLYDFERNDFMRLDKVITASRRKVLLFDEIQIIPEWERYVRQKLDENYQLIVTGSNASLLSRELGTKLTGRYLMQELFPFSFDEFCAFKRQKISANAITEYMRIGGFPEYVKAENDEMPGRLFGDILTRDIAVRYGVRDIKTLQRLALYLISNVGNLITGNKLKSIFEIGATGTVMEYLSHLEMSYLLHFVPKFSWSLKKQSINPRKVYAIDTGFVNANSASFTDDKGQIFENLVFLRLRRQSGEIYYFAEKNECDFVTFRKGAVKECIQVCYTLTPDNLKRELNGLFEALEFFNLSEGIIVTLEQSDTFEQNGKTARVVPAHVFLSDKSS